MNKRKFFASMLVTILVVIVVAGGLMTARLMFGTVGTSLSDSITNLLDKRSGDKANILLMGLDKGKQRADVIMVVSLDRGNNEVEVLSIPRDTRVQYSATRYDKINHAMGYKNPEETIIGLVKKITGMPIHYYCEVSFEGFRNVIDVLGGVEFDVPINMYYNDPAQDLYINVKKGLQVLNGTQAEGVVRYRATYATGDLQRIDLQRDFLQALFEQKLQPKYLKKAPKLLKEIYEHVETNFKLSDATKYIRMFKKMDSESLQTHMLPGASQTIGGGSYYVYDTEKTRQLILEHFGYPEDEAKALEKQRKAEAGR